MASVSGTVICSMSGVGKSYPPSRRVLDEIYLSYYYGAKIGVLGLNGSGKSTLLRILAGVEKDFDGTVAVSKGYTVGYLAQEPELDDTKTVREATREGMKATFDLLAEYEAVCAKMGESLSDAAMEKVIARQAELQEKIDSENAWDAESRLEQAMEALRCPDPETPVKRISGGERRRVAMCRLLLQRPDVLLLDEPTNHLDAETVAWLERHLQEYEGTVIAVTHDRYFLDHVAGWILELDRGKGIPFKGNYTSWLEQKEERLRQEEKTDTRRQKTLERELEWVRLSPKARQSKGKARLSAYEDLLHEKTPEKLKEFELYIPPGPRLGTVVVEFDGVSKGFGENLLMESLSFKIPPAAIVGIVGPNGAGKPTLFRMITGEEKPDAGTGRIGETVKTAYVDQSRATLDPNKNVWEEISEGQEPIRLGKLEVPSRAYVAQFNFTGQDQQKLVGSLSGGERNRVHLAKTLKSGANVLLLDEPTNDLDVNAVRALEDGLENFAGTVLVVSHDRWYLDRVATHILAFEGESRVVFFDGNWSQYEADRKRRLGVAADQPHRIKYRKLTRA